MTEQRYTQPNPAGSSHRRGQLEMVGLAFVVVILVLGAFLYLHFAVSRSVSLNATAPQARVSTPFLVALKETDLTWCGNAMTVERVAQSCMLGEPITCVTPTSPNGEPACDALQEFMVDISGPTLKAQGYKFNLTLEKTGAEVVVDCPSAQIMAAGHGGILESPSEPVKFTNGDEGFLTLTICR